MANEKTKVKTGKGLEWTLSMWDEKGFLLGIHFDRHRKYSKAQMDILKAALRNAAENLDALADSKRNDGGADCICICSPSCNNAIVGENA